MLNIFNNKIKIMKKPSLVTQSLNQTESKSKIRSSSRSSTKNYNRGISIGKKPKESEPKEIQTIDCKYCSSKICYNDFFKHLEISCEGFKTYSMKEYPSKQLKQQLCKMNINAKSTPLTEQPDPDYQARVVQDHKSLSLAIHTKEHRPQKKFTLVKEIEVPSLAIGQIHLKSFQFCVFGLFFKGRYIKYHIAYRAENNNVEVIDLLENQICATLKGHTDLVTEIKYIKTRKEYNLLLTSSYDGNLLIWEISTFKMVKKIESKSWVLSSTIATHNDQDLIFVAGGYSKNSPIKTFELESGELQYEINLKEDVIPIILEKYQLNKMSYLFVGTDSENPKFYIIDYGIKQIIKSFSMKNSISAICVYSTTNSQLFAYTSDYLGTITEFDVSKAKLNTEFSVGTNTLDLITYDDYYLMCCGDRNNSVKSIIRHKHRVGKVFGDVHSKVILNVQKFNVQGFGSCLFTLSADKKIKMFKF